MVPALPLFCCLAACTPQGRLGTDQGRPAAGDDGGTPDTDDDTDDDSDTESDSDTDTDSDSDTDTDSDSETDAPLRCNGHEALCDLRLDEVTLAGTHNSMSNADDGWWFPNQRHGITEQLDAGVRALLLDTHDYWGEPQLCHNWCDLGRQPLAEGLGEISDFLAANPGEVVMLIIQDGISPDTTADVFEEVGLVPHMWVHAPESPMPTLRALVTADTRLIVSAENEGPPPAWYHHAWDLFVDTPYTFGAVGDFTCEANRGEPSNPLFLVNHWLSAPAATEDGSREANDAAVLGARARRCELERARRVNVLAVDFYDLGDLFLVVDELNGVGTSGPAAP